MSIYSEKYIHSEVQRQQSIWHQRANVTATPITVSRVFTPYTSQHGGYVVQLW